MRLMQTAAMAFTDGGFQISASGVLSVTTQDGKQAHAWAHGFWAVVSVVASDG